MVRRASGAAPPNPRLGSGRYKSRATARPREREEGIIPSQDRAARGSCATSLSGRLAV